ncbi:isoflavone reductase like P3 [Fusarium beomiforme]|uniref:Isoflavone reductase like P3 n=1 Tax=Fusarium beomiforme TaxID=44412 RepID=A0A9P5DVW9_9HYPO|nr:isoflavone reductase like P3 [Fusarium beomiforme]
MLAAARAELASGDSGAGTNDAATKPHKKRIRNFTADDRAAHRLFEKKRRELFRERLNELAKELPALAGKNPARLSKHDVVDESISRHKFERSTCLDVIQAFRAAVQERDGLLAEVNHWRATAGMPERQATSTQMNLDDLQKLEARVRGPQSECSREDIQGSAPLDTGYAMLSDLNSQASFSPPTNSVQHPNLIGNNEVHAVQRPSFEPTGHVSQPMALGNPTMALMEMQHIPNQIGESMALPLKNIISEPQVNVITEPQLENGRPITNMENFADNSSSEINLTDWNSDFPVSSMDFGPDTILQQYCF